MQLNRARAIVLLHFGVVLSAAAGTSGPVTNASQISSGHSHSCAVKFSGEAFCWGNNASGQLGTGNNTSSTAAVRVSGLNSAVSAISAGGEHSCAITENGGVKCWGSNDKGQLGDGTTQDGPTGVDVVGLSSGVIAISTGFSHTCAITSDPAGKCWGNNLCGQFGNGTSTISLTPVSIAIDGLVAISTGYSHTCAVMDGGTAKCRGASYFGHLGNGSKTDSWTPVNAGGLTIVSAVSAGDDHSCAVASNGAKRWALNENGRLGDGKNQMRSTPADVLGLTSGVTAITGGEHHSCALTASGAAKCWGKGSRGQLRTGNQLTHLSATDVQGLTSGVASLSAGMNHSCALTQTGGIKRWGSNYFGQLGNGTSSNSLVPSDVLQA